MPSTTAFLLRQHAVGKVEGHGCIRNRLPQMPQPHIVVSGYRRLPHLAVSFHDSFTASARRSTVQRGADRRVVRDSRAGRREGHHHRDGIPEGQRAQTKGGQQAF